MREGPDRRHRVQNAHGKGKNLTTQCDFILKLIFLLYYPDGEIANRIARKFVRCANAVEYINVHLLY